MPNFNTHWLVATRVIQDYPTSVPDYLANGYAAYQSIVEKLSVSVDNKLAAIDDTIVPSKGTFQTMFGDLITDAEQKIKNEDVYDDITCFSAYTLGACGPDFWTLPSESWSPVPNFAGLHFDLGHYNRTHEQFNVALRRWAKMPGGLQKKVEQSYYFGMATHIAADLVIHELVNVYAGAYQLLEKAFENEQGYLTKNIWNTHNKVEHYWDSYIRYRYLGDYGPIFPKAGLTGDKTGKKPDDTDILMDPLLAPTADRAQVRIDEIIAQIDRTIENHKKELSNYSITLPWKTAPKRKTELTDLIEKLGKKRNALQKARDWFTTEVNVFSLERFLSPPRIVCDRIIGTGLKPFIYEVAVRKDNGAYPRDDVFAEADTEATSSQMKAKGGGYNEASKLRFFSTELIGGSANHGNNYLTYYSCPNLDKVKKYANNAFYDLKALDKFVESAVGVAEKFVTDLHGACGVKSGTPDIGSLGHFWNLDTGLGLRVVNVVPDTGKEAITSLDFIHITDYLRKVTLAYDKDTGYLGGKKTLDYTNPDGKPAFPTYAMKGKVPKITDIKENDPEKYVEQIKVQTASSATTDVTIDSFFTKLAAHKEKSENVSTTNTTPTNTMELADIKHRLTLRLDTSLIRFGSENASFYVHSDDKNALDGAAKEGATSVKKWFDLYKKGCSDYICTEGDVNTSRMTTEGNRLRFRSYMLLNLEQEKDTKRCLGGDAGAWNNVIEHAKHTKHYGRNFVLSTGRSDVLKPVGGGNFNPFAQYGYYKNTSPTEQIFFTLYPLVRNGDKVYDAISKAEVTKEQLKEYKKIDCLGFVKIVLFYVMTPGGASQVDECYVDGLKVPVERASV